MTTALTFNLWPSSLQTLPVPAKGHTMRIDSEYWTSFTVSLALQSASEFHDATSRTRDWLIEQSDLPSDEPYQILKPIPVRVRRDTDLEFTATFQQGNLSIGGTSYRDAFQALIYEILDVFDHFRVNKDSLGPGPERQLAILERHIVKIDR